jgi:hypothetical protein
MAEMNHVRLGQSTFKYLSNTKDPNTGKVSEPFSIEGKRYQMVEGYFK